MLAESLPNAPVLLTVHLRSGWERSPTTRWTSFKDQRIHNFGIMLEPRWIIGTGLLDQ
jgi:hypothetical protein